MVILPMTPEEEERGIAEKALYAKKMVVGIRKGVQRTGLITPVHYDLGCGNYD